MNANVFEHFRAHFPEDRDRPFIETADGRSYSYAELETSTGRIASLLTAVGVRPSDRVVAQVGKSAEAIFLYLACARAGAIYLPLNSAYRQAELAYFLGDAEPTVVVCDPSRADEHQSIVGPGPETRRVLTLGTAGDGTLIEESCARDPSFATIVAAPDDVVAILYTSGTTGRSKGAMLTHRNLATNAMTLRRLWGFGPDDVLLHPLPLFHAHGLFVAANCVLASGSRMLLLPRFDQDEVIRLLPRATVMMGVPTYYTRLLAHPELTTERCRTIRLFISGSAPLLEETFTAFRERTGHTILERYGMSETLMCTSNPLDGLRLAGTVGTPLPDVEVRVTDDDENVLPSGKIGELEVRGPNVFKGYWRMPEKTRAEFRADGFFKTGDLARIDENGYVSIVGRTKDLIISGGLNIYPKEIEAHIDTLPGVAESVVFGIPHGDFGEAMIAAVRPEEPSGDVTAEAVVAELKCRLAGFKVPKKVVFVEDIPRNAMGKVQKTTLRERYKDCLDDG